MSNEQASGLLRDLVECESADDLYGFAKAAVAELLEWRKLGPSPSEVSKAIDGLNNIIEAQIAN